MRKNNHNNRLSYENMLRKLAFEANKTPFKDAIDYLTDKELLTLINGFLFKLGLIPFTTNELNKNLSLKKYGYYIHLPTDQN